MIGRADPRSGTHMRPLQWLLIFIFATLAGSPATAQQTRSFKGRLSPVPIDASMLATIAGAGSVTAVLNGTKLTITGSFEGLRSPATIAQVHKGPARGVRGPVVADLAVAKSADPTSGTLSATLELTTIQIADLDKGRLYVQLHSEKAPDGNLWGWLLPLENRR
jgi:CHRD domain